MPAARATFRVSYTVRGARWAPLYDARLDSGTRERKPALELIRRAEIVQQTGEDWSDVALSVSTVRTAKGGSAPELRPLIVRYPSRRRAGREPRDRPDRATRAGDLPARSPSADAAAGRAGDDAAQHAARRSARPRSRPAAIRSSSASPAASAVAANEGAKSFRIATATIAPDLLVRATPALDETAYPRSLVQAGRGGAAAARAASRSIATASLSAAARWR